MVGGGSHKATLCCRKSDEDLCVNHKPIKMQPIYLNGNIVQDHTSCSQSIVELNLVSCQLKLPEIIKTRTITHLRKLNISDNGLEVLPDCIEKMYCLQELNVSRNKLKSIPVPIGQLHSLSVVNLSHNCLEVFPLPVNCLECLVKLDISHNKITQLETRPRWLKIIAVLYLNNNLLRRLPSWLNDVTHLQDICIDHNPLSFTSGKEQYRCKRLGFQGSSFASTNIDFPMIRCLRFLRTSHCGLVMFPSCILRLQNLVELDLGNSNLPPHNDIWKQQAGRHNLLTWIPNELPACLGSTLEVLNLANNCISGLPLDMSPLQFLRVLLVQNNPLMWLPQSFCKLSSLQICDISNCDLIDVPQEIGELRALTSLRLSHNKIHSLPKSMHLLSSLEYLDLYSNYLESLPEFLLTLPNLSALDLGLNCFLFNEKLECTVHYEKLKLHLRSQIKTTRTDDLQRVSNLTEANWPYPHSSGSSGSKSDSEWNDNPDEEDQSIIAPKINESQHVPLVENWSESEDDDLDFPLSDYIKKSQNNWAPSDDITKSYHYFCPADIHASDTQRTKKKYTIQEIELGQFDDAD